MTTPTPDEVESMTDLASATYGSRVLFATDEWFAPASRLLLPEPPLFIPDKFTSFGNFGKWMDGWETQRKRTPGHDWCILALGLRGVVDVVDVDTAFFTGNNPPRVSIQAADFSKNSDVDDTLRLLTSTAPDDRVMGVCATPEEFELVEQLQSDTWTEIVRVTKLAPGYAETRHNLLRVPLSKRGKDWVVLKLGHLGVIQNIEVDTNHFKGNFPESCILYGTRFYGDDQNELLTDQSVKWEVILPRVKLQAHKQQYFSVDDGNVNLVTAGVNYVKLEMFPDGGISRLRLFGRKKKTAARL
ncbi:Allantoicase [Phytophthora megakarya]|uniref:Allantoicase n=1 Tax=Phytophthora megakarya TaxID=4795 RepID=A0A225WEX2_9STRA|nr:Allantoicase [Phytophthora megakarya]